ncbi:MAG: VanZ family protein [Actinomyces sp.]|jgi:putative membrane protein|nr:VanZ family protein [Actinomyces sp.]
MYTAINWGLDLGLYAAVCAIVCALWWLLGRRGNPSATAGRAEASTDSAQSAGRVSRAGLTVAQALPLIYRRSKRTGALLPREENPDTPTTAEIPVVAAPSSSMWRLPRALPLAWILYLAGLLIFTLLPLPSDPVAACAAIIHWDNYTPFGSFVAVADQFRDGESLRGTLYALSILLNIALFVPLGALAETTWRMRRAPEGAPADGSRLARSIPHRRVLAWVAIGCALSCLIELTQYTGLFGVVPCTYRVVDIDDVIMNTLGTYAGVRLLPFMARNSRFMGA